ncbi:hypothetical protein [Allochromatium palmeri]|uniref:Uncharacterized protein n=1 Tax=Allochromatium palmeri TaxID=231048 RepID=A0A6N8EF58_9GAMM|nr:hypothetical protein [Allochromatium palmeri]MTW22291.1 hypothetical protein [Allochromatium palmeri]
MHAATADLQKCSQHEQMNHWRQELKGLSQPRTYRERVLVNVYRQLIQSREGDSEQSHSRPLLVGMATYQGVRA